MPEPYDWAESETRYWEQHGPLEYQIARNIEMDKIERRSEMNAVERMIDRLMCLLFPSYIRFHHTHRQRPPMRLIYTDGTPSNLIVGAPIPRSPERKRAINGI
jgi:predicted transposase YdaD